MQYPWIRHVTSTSRTSEFTSPSSPVTPKDAPAAAAQLKSTVGVVDHGLFIGMATEVIVAGKEGVYVLPRRK